MPVIVLGIILMIPGISSAKEVVLSEYTDDWNPDGNVYHVIYQTVWNDDLKWELQGDQLLITGKGAIPDYSNTQPHKMGIQGMPLSIYGAYKVDGNDIYIRTPPWKYSQSKIGSIKIGHGVTRVGDQAFDGGETDISSHFSTENIKAVSLPDTLKSIGREAFYNCINLENIDIPNSVKTIEGNAFSYCKITKIVIPDSMETIGDYAFSEAEEVVIGAGLREYNRKAFKESLLRKITVSPDNPELKSVDGVLYNQGGTRLELYPQLKSDSSFTMPEGVKIIGADSISHNKYLQTLTFSSTVRSVEYRAIENCDSLKKVYLNNGIKTFDLEAFWYCNGLTEMTFPYGVTNLPNMDGCYGIRTVTIPETVKDFLADYPMELIDADTGEIWSMTTSFEFRIFDKSGNQVRPLIRCVKDSEADKWARRWRYPVEYIKNVEVETPYAKDGLTYLLNEKKKTAVVTGSENANEKTIAIPDTVKTDGKKYQVIGISEGAFKGMKKLKTVTIGKNVTSIGKNAFYGCKKLSSIRIKSTGLTAKTVGANAFKGIASKVVIKCPLKKLKDYKALLVKKGVPKKATFRE